MKLTIAKRALYHTIEEWRSTDPLPFGKPIPINTEIEYVAHLPGGMVKALYDGREIVIHPGATKELS